jgi:hypothetical protein
MEGYHVFIICMTIILSCFTGLIIRQRTQSGDERHRREKECEKDKQWAEIVKASHEMSTSAFAIIENANKAQDAMLRSVLQNRRGFIFGEEVNKATAEYLLLPEQKLKSGHKANGVYEIISVNTQNPRGLKGSFKRRDDGLQFTAEINFEDLTKEEVMILAVAIAEKNDVRLSVNAVFSDNDVVKAFILKIENP